MLHRLFCKKHRKNKKQEMTDRTCFIAYKQVTGGRKGKAAG